MWLTATDLKQWLYCRRVVYYERVVPVAPAAVSTDAMSHGRIEQEQIERLELRRKLNRYGIEEGRREFGVFVESPRLELRGRLDLAIAAPPGTRMPVDFKWTPGEPAANHCVQVVAYAMMLEEMDGGRVERGFVVTLPGGTVHAVQTDAESRERVERSVAEMRAMVERGVMPEKADRRSKCEQCEYRNFCGDVF